MDVPPMRFELYQRHEVMHDPACRDMLTSPHMTGIVVAKARVNGVTWQAMMPVGSAVTDGTFPADLLESSFRELLERDMQPNLIRSGFASNEEES